MRCEEWSERLAGRVSGEAEPGGADLDRHLESCSRCRAELAGLEETWDGLARDGEPHVPTERMRARLRSAIAPPLSRRKAPVGRLAVAALIAVAAFLAGRFAKPSAATSSVDGRPRYLLLLHERPGSAAETPEQARRVVDEYKAWAKRLRAEGKLVGGEKLSEGGTVLSSAGERRIGVSPGEIGGYFVIRAATPEEALDIARDCPHVRRGGTVELRPIENV
ncbi:MAG TPA: YciI family protein [Thermoanaerobaculia bacterium]